MGLKHLHSDEAGGADSIAYMMHALKAQQAEVADLPGPERICARSTRHLASCFVSQAFGVTSPGWSCNHRSEIQA